MANDNIAQTPVMYSAKQVRLLQTLLKSLFIQCDVFVQFNNISRAVMSSHCHALMDYNTCATSVLFL